MFKKRFTHLLHSSFTFSFVTKMNTLIRNSSKCYVLLKNYTNVRQYGFFGNILERFKKKEESDEKFIVGEDQFGNKYYEKEPSPEAPRQVPRRWIKYNENSEIVTKQEEEEDTRYLTIDAEIPVEWKAWLQMRRKSPPTLEELLRNEAIKLRTIQRAKELEQKENEAREAQINPDLVTDSNANKKSEFPVYPEYDTKIGEYKSDFLDTESDTRQKKK